MRLMTWIYAMYIQHLRKQYRMRLMMEAAARGKGWSMEGATK